MVMFGCLCFLYSFAELLFCLLHGCLFHCLLQCVSYCLLWKVHFLYFVVFCARNSHLTPKLYLISGPRYLSLNLIIFFLWSMLNFIDYKGFCSDQSWDYFLKLMNLRLLPLRFFLDFFPLHLCSMYYFQVSPTLTRPKAGFKELSYW